MKNYLNIPYELNSRRCDGIYDCYNGAVMFYWGGVDESALASYGTELEKIGYTVYQEYEDKNIHSATYRNGDISAHTYYLKRVGEFRVIIQENAEFPINPYGYEKLCAPAVTQLGIYNDPKVYTGMGYLIRLADGTFVVIDGGIELDYNGELLYNLLCEQKPDGIDDIVIAAWILTHDHGDHFGVIKNFLENYEDKVTLRMLIGNEISDYVYATTEKGTRSFDFYSVAGHFGGCVLMKAHTGQKFYFPGVTFTVLRTHEDIYPQTMHLFNDVASTVFDAVIGDTRILWLADVEKSSAPRLQEMYGEDLKCDVMQIAHHGIGNGWDDLYALCNPRIAFWPAGDEVLTYKNGIRFERPHIKYLVETTEQMIYAAYGSHTIEFEK